MCVCVGGGGGGVHCLGGNIYLSFSINPLHGSSREEREDETE